MTQNPSSSTTEGDATSFEGSAGRELFVFVDDARELIELYRYYFSAEIDSREVYFFYETHSAMQLLNEEEFASAIIVLDYKMTTSYGTDFAEEVKSRFGDKVKIIMYTNMPLEEDIKSSCSAGYIDMYMNKGYADSLRDLGQAVFHEFRQD
jgi:response regulator RpfG family c-di-GMP phosphodiesterase